MRLRLDDNQPTAKEQWTLALILHLAQPTVLHDLSAREARMLIAMISLADSKAEIGIGNASLAAVLNLNKQEVANVLNSLEVKGLIKTLQRSDPSRQRLVF